MQIAHVVADAGDAEQPRLLVEHRFHGLRIEAERLEQVEHDAGIDRTGSRAHAQAVERGEAERAVDALAVAQRAQAGAAAEVRHDHAAAGDLRRHLRQHRGDVLVGQAVKAVALNARVADLFRAAAPDRPPRMWPRWKLVSKHATCGTCGQARACTASMAARLCG